MAATSIGPITAPNITVTADVQTVTLGVSGIAEVTGELHAYGGIETEIIYVGQVPRNAGEKLVYIGTGPSTNVCEMQSLTWPGTYDQTLELNPLGGNVSIGSGVHIDYAGNITAGSAAITGDLTAATAEISGKLTAGSAAITGDLTANSAEFATCLVASSPVRTFANTADAPEGMVWPTAGIAVSSGSAWAASINPANVPLLNAAVNTFQHDLVAVSFHATAASALAVTPSTAWMDFQGGNGRFVTTGPSTGTLAGIQFVGIDSAGANFTEFAKFTTDASRNVTFTVDGTVIGNSFNYGPRITSGNATVGGIDYYQNLCRCSAINQSDTAHCGGFAWWGYSEDFSQTTNYLSMLHDSNGPHLVVPVTFWCANAHLRLGDRSVGGWTTGVPNINSDGQSLILNPTGANGLYFNWDQGTGGVVFGNGALTQVAKVDSNGNATFANVSGTNGTFSSSLSTNGPLACFGLQIGLGGSLPSFGTHGCELLTDAGNPNWSRLGVCGDSAQRGGLSITGISNTASLPAKLYATFTDGTNAFYGSTLYATTLTAGTTAQIICGEDPSTSANWAAGVLSFAPNQGTNSWGIMHLEASKSGVGWCDIQIAIHGGNIFMGLPGGGSATTVYGSFTVQNGAKTFRTTHPLDDTKYLTHACLEGPENGVFYRGEAVTVKGVAEVTLPDYFELLTMPTNRTVQLTQIIDGVPVFAQLAASRVVKGKFSIYSSLDSVNVYWEVKAIRADIEPLEVITQKETAYDAHPIPNPTAEPPGTERSGTPQAGEPKSKKVRA
jgi:hypothetical protein